MKFLTPIFILLVGASALSIPENTYRNVLRDAENVELNARAPKGGGGGGGKGGGGSSSSGKGGSSSSSSSSGKTGSSSSSGGKGLGSSSSSTGGRTSAGSGVTPRVGGFYGGGASVPYASGQRSASGISPLLIGAGLGFGFGALWVHGAYNYPYTHPFVFHNDTTNSNETKPVNCLCAVGEECGCDDNTNSTYVSSLIGNGSYAALNQSLVNVADVNGSSTIVINGTLPNGTTASGGTVSANGASLPQSGGYLALVTLISAGVFLI